MCEVHNSFRGKTPCVCEPPFKLFPFPTIKKNSDARKRWIKLLKRQDLRGKPWEPKPSSRVCSAHFVSGKPTDENPDPVLKLGYQSTVSSLRRRKLPTERTPPLPLKRSRKSETHETVTDTDFANPSTSRVGGHEFPSTATNHKKSVDDTSIGSESMGDFGPNTNDNKQSNKSHIFSDHGYCYGWQEMAKPDFCFKENCLKEKHAKAEELRKLRDYINELEQKLEQCRSKIKANENKGLRYTDLRKDATVRQLTGIPTRGAFDKLFCLVNKNVKKVNFWVGPTRSVKKGRNFKRTPKKFGPQRVLSKKDEFLLTLMKLRLGSTSADLAQRFGIGTTTVSNVFTTWIKILSKELGFLVYNPSKDVVKKTLPAKFKKPGYSNVRHIIDCTEIFIETPSNPTVRAATWSDYKHHNTAKVLVSITPNGAFNFVSKAWGGRTSDVNVTRESSFYDMCEPYDEVMADRGFTIAEDLILRHCKLHIPPGRRGKEQFSKAEVNKTKKIANLRIYVEQAIRRLKTFRLIKNELPISLLNNIDAIVLVCAALCNLYSPLGKTK